MSDCHELHARPLTREEFAPYGDVIDAPKKPAAAMNGPRFDRFDDLAAIDVAANAGGRPGIGIVRSRSATVMPYCFDTVERHPLGTQAFVPLASFRLVVVVAPPGDRVELADLRAFVTNGQQGISYHRGTWHMPLISLEEGQRFLLIDRLGDEENCDMHVLDRPVMLFDS